MKQVRQQDAYRQTEGVQLKLVATPRPLYKGNISICLYASI